MLKTILIALLTMTVLQSKFASATVTPNPEQVVVAFQKIPHYEMFCKEANWTGRDFFKEGEKFKTILSKELYKLFSWSQCWEPEIPPHYGPLKHFINFDIRFSIPDGNFHSYDKPGIQANSIRITNIKQVSTNKVTLTVHFTYQAVKQLTNYTLIREDGQWKIDDISPRGKIVGPDQEGYLEVSDSIKTDMQNNFNAAMERYNQEQTKKGVTNKK